MLRRRSTQDGDVVASARRRLAALAAHHDPGREASDGAAEQSTAASGPGIAESLASRSSHPVSHQRLSPPARHLGERRTELGRWGVTGQHVTVVALCLLVLVVLVAWWP